MIGKRKKTDLDREIVKKQENFDITGYLGCSYKEISSKTSVQYVRRPDFVDDEASMPEKRTQHVYIRSQSLVAGPFAELRGVSFEHLAVCILNWKLGFVWRVYLS